MNRVDQLTARYVQLLQALTQNGVTTEPMVNFAKMLATPLAESETEPSVPRNTTVRVGNTVLTRPKLVFIAQGNAVLSLQDEPSLGETRLTISVPEVEQAPVQQQTEFSRVAALNHLGVL